MKIIMKILVAGLLLPLVGCATTNLSAYKYNPKNTAYHWGDESQIEVGQPNIIIDSIGNITGIPGKVLLLNPKMENHNISSKTIQVIEKYVDDNPEDMRDTKIRINQFAPVGEFKRLIKNKKVEWWWRIFPGIPTTMLSLAGRVVGGDHYNPYTDTINIYSDVPAVTLHEAGHAVDFSEHAEKGTAGIYALGRMLMPVTLHQEHAASEKAINYLKDTKDREGEKEAYKSLYPAYGTYVGGAVGIPFASVAGAAVGHVASIVPRYNQSKASKSYDEAKWSGEIVKDLKSDPLVRTLLDEYEKKEKLLDDALMIKK